MAEYLGQTLTSGVTNSPAATDFFNGHVPMNSTSHDPYMSGFAFIKWITVPKWLPNPEEFKLFSERNFKAFSGLSDIQMDTSAVTAGFTSNESHYAKSITKNSDFTLKYTEHSGSPLTKQYNAWVSGIRDPKTGIATYPGLAGAEDYHSSNHTGVLLYVVTRPDADNFAGGRNIEFAALYTKIMPTKIALNHFNYENGNHDVTDLDQEFKAYMHIGPKVETFAKDYITKNRYSFSTENSFTNITNFTG